MPAVGIGTVSLHRRGAGRKTPGGRRDGSRAASLTWSTVGRPAHPAIIGGMGGGRRGDERMGPTEYLLLILVIVVPLVIAVVVTLWTLEQTRARSKKHRRRPAPKTDAGQPPSATP